jgi:subtilisin family serine protease
MSGPSCNRAPLPDIRQTSGLVAAERTGRSGRFSLAALTAALAPVLLLASCGGGGDEAGSSAPPASRPASANGNSPAPAYLVVMLEAGASIEPLLQRHGLARVAQFGQRPIYRLRAASQTAADSAVSELRGETTVRFAERDVEVASPEARRASVWAVGQAGGDLAAPYVNEVMGLAAAHAVSRGEGVRVAVLDTGVDLTHPQIAPRLARDGAGRVLGRDFVDGDDTPAEVGSVGELGYGHGTHVAALVGVAAPAARLMPARVLDRAGGGNAWVLAEALAWAVDPDGDPLTDDGAHVINLSLGSTTPTDLLKTVSELVTCEFDDDDDDFADPGFDEDRARCASGRRAVVVAAAGNSGSDNEMIYPAAEGTPGSLAVTASNAERRLATFANWGSWIRLAAPGDALLSAVPGGGYGVWSGTSMATPLAAGAAALVMATLPPGGDASRPSPAQWVPEMVVKRLTDRPVKLCGTSFMQVHAEAAVKDQPQADPICP